MTPTEIINRSYKFLIEQGKPAVHNGHCFYKRINGDRCAVGCLLADDLAKELETSCHGKSIEQVIKKNIELPQWIKDNNLLLQKIQNAHDNYTYCLEKDWSKYITDEYQEIANEYDVELEI